MFLWFQSTYSVYAPFIIFYTDPDGYHFETAHWVRGIAHFPMSFMMMWARKHHLPDQVTHQIFEKKIDGNKMLQLINDEQLAAALDTDKKTVRKILKALKQDNSTILL